MRVPPDSQASGSPSGSAVACSQLYRGGRSSHEHGLISGSQQAQAGQRSTPQTKRIYYVQYNLLELAVELKLFSLCFATFAQLLTSLFAEPALQDCRLELSKHHISSTITNPHISNRPSTSLHDTSYRRTALTQRIYYCASSCSSCRSRRQTRSQLLSPVCTVWPPCARCKVVQAATFTL